MTMTVLIPTLPRSADDVARSSELMQEIESIGFKAGTMLVIERGLNGLSDESTTQYHQNLRSLKTKVPVVVMLSNMPVEDMDWLHDPNKAMEHVKRGVHFTAGLSWGLDPIVTFHLSSLVTKEE